MSIAKFPLPDVGEGLTEAEIDPTKPVVCFGSFQDFLGKNSAGGIKAKNEWVHAKNWDCVIFDEYHYGAWRENAKELFEAEDKREIVAAEGAGLEYFRAAHEIYNTAYKEACEEFLKRRSAAAGASAVGVPERDPHAPHLGLPPGPLGRSRRLVCRKSRALRAGSAAAVQGRAQSGLLKS